jgi:hypothetical protein
VDVVVPDGTTGVLLVGVATGAITEAAGEVDAAIGELGEVFGGIDFAIYSKGASTLIGAGVGATNVCEGSL